MEALKVVMEKFRKNVTYHNKTGGNFREQRFGFHIVYLQIKIDLISFLATKFEKHCIQILFMQ